MKIVSLGCTHNQHNYITIPECDVLIHTGDYTQIGSSGDVMNFYEWLGKQTQAKHKIFIEGNHELMADSDGNVRKYTHTAKYDDWLAYLKSKQDDFTAQNIYRLHNESITIDGIKFWGSPYTLAFHSWAFNMSLDELKDNWKECPTDTDVLVTHGPPLGKLDWCLNGQHAGDAWLLQKLIEMRPKLHLFSHIHESHGHTTIGVADEKQTDLYNVSILGADYSIENQPTVIYI